MHGDIMIVLFFPGAFLMRGWQAFLMLHIGGKWKVGGIWPSKKKGKGKKQPCVTPIQTGVDQDDSYFVTIQIPYVTKIPSVIWPLSLTSFFMGQQIRISENYIA